MAEAREVLVSIKDLEVFFDVRNEKLFSREKKVVKAVNHINLDIYKGETLGLVGESGCGKTTLGKSILRLIPATDGEVIYQFEDGKKDLLKLNKKEMDQARKKLQIVFQDPQSSLNPSFTVYQTLATPLERFGVKSKEERVKIITELLASVNMRPEYMNRYPSEFSGGQRQRIGIARALSVDPELVVCDEAVSALDVSIQAQVLQLLKKLKDERGLTYLFITHNLSVVEYISDRVAVMYLGKIVEVGETKELFRNAGHPYTMALLSAIPVADVDNTKKRIVLEGDVPSPINLPSGCSFHGRCKYCQKRCEEEVPELRCFYIDGAEHHVACHYAEKFLFRDKTEEVKV